MNFVRGFPPEKHQLYTRSFSIDNRQGFWRPTILNSTGLFGYTQNLALVPFYISREGKIVGPFPDNSIAISRAQGKFIKMKAEAMNVVVIRMMQTSLQMDYR
jgi:hypothetical protein